MALKPDRFESFVNTEFFMNETGEAGSVVVFDTSAPSGVGASLDDVNGVVKLPDNQDGSGEAPAGILVGDVVNKDLTQTHLNQHKRESQIGGKVGIIRDGSIVTNRIASGVSPKAGDPAYFTTEGVFKTTDPDSVGTRVGTFLSGKDSDGYAKVDVDLP